MWGERRCPRRCPHCQLMRARGAACSWLALRRVQGSTPASTARGVSRGARGAPRSLCVGRGLAASHAAAPKSSRSTRARPFSPVVAAACTRPAGRRAAGYARCLRTSFAGWHLRYRSWPELADGPAGQPRQRAPPSRLEHASRSKGNIFMMGCSGPAAHAQAHLMRPSRGPHRKQGLHSVTHSVTHLRTPQTR